MKERITVTIEKEFLEWIDKKSDLKVFANRSHGFEFLIKSAQLRESKDMQKTKHVDKKSNEPNHLGNEGAL